MKIISTTLLSSLFVFSVFYTQEQHSKNFLSRNMHALQSDFYTLVKIPWWYNINEQDSLGYTMLHYAVEQGNLTLVRYLLSHRADPNIQSYVSLQTPLHIAAMYGVVRGLQLLVQSGGNVNIQDIYHRTPIFYATDIGSLAVVNLLKHLGASLKIEDIEGNNLLDIALLHHYRNIVLDLIAYRGVRDSIQKDEVINFLSFWKTKYNTLFHITPFYEYPEQEYYSAQLGFLSFECVEFQSVNLYLLRRMLRKQMYIDNFNWLWNICPYN